MPDIDVGQLSEAINNKVDLNQLNTNAQGLSYGSGWGMPSSRYVDLTLGASGSTYTAPANGWFTVDKLSSGDEQNFSFINTTNGININVQIAGTGHNRLYIPAKKNNVIECRYSTTGTTNYFRFIYAEGEPSS